MSVDSRLAAKERSRKARKKAFWRKWGVFIGAAAIAVVVLADILLFKWIDNLNNHPNFGRYISKDGTLIGVNTKEYFSSFPNLDELQITSTLEVSEEDYNTNLVSIMKTLMSIQGATDLVAEDATDEDVLALLNDEWVTTYGTVVLSDAYEKNVSGFEKYMKDALDDQQFNTVEEEVYQLVKKYAVLKDTPKKYSKFMRKRGMEFLTKTDYVASGNKESDFESYILSEYGDRASFRSELEDTARQDVEDALIWLTVYDELGLNYTMEDYKADRFKESTLSEEEKVAAWEALQETYPIEYLFMQFKCSKALEELTYKLVGAEQ